MSGALGVLIWLICIGISAILIGYFLRELQKPEKKEGFTMLVCPAGSVSYITRNGDTQCCNGDVVDGWCSGNDICTLSPRSNNNLPTCGDYLASNLKQAGINLCPTTIPNYFASLDGSVRGCSVSQPLPNGIGPSDPNQLQCILYPTDNLDKVRLDSCYNYGLQQAEKAKLSQCAPSTSLQAPQAKQVQTSPTGYYLLPGSTNNDGTDIVGELPVTKIIDPDKYIIYLAQDAQYIKTVTIHRNTGDRVESYVFPGSLSNIRDIESYRDEYAQGLSEGHKDKSKQKGQRNYRLKKPDGTIL